MTKNFMDLVTDELKGQIRQAQEEARLQFKGKDPYRKERVDDKQRLYEYDQTPEEQKQFGRQNFPDQYAIYEEEIEKIRRRYNA